MKITKLILACLFLSCISIANAATDAYNVEIIVFRQPQQNAAAPEQWPSNPAIPTVKNSQIHKHEPGHQHLNHVVARLNKTGFPVIFHQASLVRLPHGTKPWDLPIQVQSSETRDWVVSGVVDIQNIGLMQVKVNLVARPMDSSNRMLPWKTVRRLHLKEMHYFDHPLYGMLISVHPV